jgi:tRNA(Ile)-lysidine synthase
MARSHPPTLLTRVRRTLIEECELGAGEHLLVAVSGGGDSGALLHALAKLAGKLGFVVSAHGVDHGLRGEAAEELGVARRLADRLAVPFSTSRVHIRPGGNLQARARAARYQALHTAARCVGATLIATAHHADDRAETVLMRILRGSGPRGLQVLPPRSGPLVRPMIRVRRAAVAAHLRRHRIEYVHDPSNADRRFLRVRVRLDVLPLLEAISPNVVEHLNALADQVGSEPPPRLLDADGRVVALGREQVEQIRRAQRLGLSGVRVRLSGGREISFDPKTARIRLHEAPATPARRSARPAGDGNRRQRA